MDKNLTEIFGEFSYAESMTYEELLEFENLLIEQLDFLFKDGGAEHLDFTPLGDILMMQCAFEFQNLEILRDIAQEVAAMLPAKVKGRLLCLEKNLVSCHFFWIRQGQWQEKKYTLPQNGPDDAPVYKVDIQPPAADME